MTKQHTGPSIVAEAIAVLSRHGVYFTGTPQITTVYKAICKIRGRRPERSDFATQSFALRVFIDEHREGGRGDPGLLLQRPEYRFDIGMRMAMERVAEARAIGSIG